MVEASAAFVNAERRLFFRANIGVDSAGTTVATRLISRMRRSKCMLAADRGIAIGKATPPPCRSLVGGLHGVTDDRR